MSDTDNMRAADDLGEGEQEQEDKGEQGENEVNAGGRALTEKEKDYQVSVIKGKMESCKRKWIRVGNKIKKSLKDTSSLPELESMTNEELEAFSQYTMECSKLRKLDPEESEILKYELEQSQRSHKEILESIFCRKKELTDDKGSVCSSKQTRRSRVSSTPSRSSAQRKQEATAKVVRLRREMEYDDRLAEEEALIAEEEVALNKKRAMLARKRREKDLAMASAEVEACGLIEEEIRMLPNNDESVGKQNQLQQYLESQNELKVQAIAEQGSNIVMPQKQDSPHNLREPILRERVNNVMTIEADKQVNRPLNLNPTAQSFVPCVCSHTQNVSMPNVGQTCQAPFMPAGNFSTNVNLPIIEPHIFSGDPMEFPVWMKTFENYIESKVRTGADRLALLKKYTCGDAHEAVRMILSLDTDADYMEAKSILKQRFGSKSIIADAYIKRLMNWPPVLPRNGPALRAFSDFLRSCRVAMKHTSHLSFLDNPREQRKLLTKLPVNMADKWRTMVTDYIINKSNSSFPEMDEEYHPPFEMLNDFVLREAEGANNPFTSHDAINIEANEWNKYDTGTRAAKWKPNSTARNKGIRTFMAKSTEEQPMCSFQSKVNVQASKQFPKEQEGKRRSCYYCTKDHDLDECREFAKLDGNTRRTFAIERRLCTGCLKFGHKGMHCRRRKLCKVCQRRHPTALHDDESKRL